MKEKLIGTQIFPQNLSEKIYMALGALPNEYFTNGRTACYHHVISIIDSHMNKKILDNET